MKGPNRGGRILKDPRNVLGVAPLTSAEIGGGVGKGIHSRADNQLPQLVPHAPLITRRRSSIDPLSSDSLQKHIHELEIENLQLKSRLQETELSLKNYKDFLTTKSSLNNQNISTQTDNYDNDEDDNINHEKSILNNEIKLLQNENVTLKNQINSLMINQTTSNNISQEYNQKIQELEQSLLMMKRKKSKVKKMSTPPPREDMKVNYKELIATELNDFNKLLCCNLELIRHRISSFNQHSPKGKISIPLKIPPVDQACGPMTPTVVDRSHDPPTPSLKFNGWSVSPIPPRQKIESVTVATNTDPLDEKQDDELANQLQLQTLLAQSLSERLLSASKSVHGVVTKFGNEINAIKHWAHCKELVRVATLRELGLEKDRLLNELKYSKDLQNVLLFSLDTAEQMLSEINPQLVVKLQESRNKRMFLLEKEVKEKRKDIEQRSMETCAVSTTHLESFQSKAELKCKLAAEESQNGLLLLQNILQQR